MGLSRGQEDVFHGSASSADDTLHYTHVPTRGGHLLKKETV